MGVSGSLSRAEIAWVIVGVIIAAFVFFVVGALFGALLVGLFLYYAMRPVYRLLNARFDHPDVNATVTLLLVGLPMLAILVYGGFVALREFDQFLAAANLEELRTMLQPYVDVSATLNRQAVMEAVRGNLSRISGLVGAAGLWILRVFVIVVVAFYLLRDDYKVADWFRSTFADYPLAIEYLEAVDDDLTTLYTGNLLTIVATTIIAVVTFYVLNLLAPGTAGISYPILLGLLVGIGTFIPAVGMKIVYVPYGLFLLWQSLQAGGPPLWFPVVFFVVTLLVVDSFPDLVVRSYVSKGQLNMGLVMLSYVLGAIAFGWYGIFFAPVILVAAVHFARDVVPRLVGTS